MPSNDPNSILSNARDTSYPNQVWWFLASFIALVSLYHFTALLFSRNHKSARTDPEQTTDISTNKISLRRLPSAIQETVSILLYRYTVPLGNNNRLNWAEISVVTGYIIVVLTWTFVNSYDSDTGLKIDPNYYADRAGNIVASHIPLIVLLSGKNNLLSLITGISFEKLHILHRAIARFSVVLILIHACGRISLGLTGGDVITNGWLRMGIAAFAAWVILVVMFIKPLRTRFYNIFVSVHIVFSLIILIGLYYHIMGAGGYQNYLIPAYVFWALDRVLRIARIIWNNRGIHPSPIKAEVISSDMIKLSIHQNMFWKAGQSAYITIPTISWLPFESHPFTIATIPTTETGVPSELVFLVKVRNGFTKRLYQAIAIAQERNKELQLNAFIDGPYGSPSDLTAFSEVIIITGGSGISFGLPLLHNIARKVENNQSACVSVLLVWAVATAELNVEGNHGWVLDSLNEVIQHAPPSLRIRIRLYATRETSSVASLNEVSDKEKDDAKKMAYSADVEKVSSPTGSEADRIALTRGRPNIQSLLEEEISCADSAVSVNVAGPPSMVEDVRRALRFKHITPKATLKGYPRVYLHTEPYEIA